MSYRSLKSSLLASAIPAIVLAGEAWADAGGSASEQPLQTGDSGRAQAAPVERIVITGSRGQPRSVMESTVPIDVFGVDDLERSSQIDTLNVLQALVPSFSVPRAANTTSNTFIRAPSLRGLAADKTLLLLNSRRRHKSGSVGVSGTGSHAADAAVIPSIALSSVEVLRDGAAAQYGSDAIAGVINFILRDDREGGSLIAQAGQYYEGDGDDYLIAGNIGLPLTDAGFLNLSAQWNRTRRTIRSAQFTSSSFDALEEAARNPVFADAVDLSEPLERVGRPKEHSVRLVANSGIDLTADSEIYAFGNYSWSEGIAAATYRVPGAGHQVMDNPIRLSDGTEWRFMDWFPGGLRPQFAGEVTDWSLAGGYRFERDLASGRTFAADIGARYGWNKIAYSMTDTVNPSMGPESPLYFDASSYVSDEFAVNADFTWTTPVTALAGPLALSFGAEYRVEGFEIQPGEWASYSGGRWAQPDPFGFCLTDGTLSPGAPTGAGIDCSDPSDPVYNILQPGSNGITGLGPRDSGDFSTDSWSLYAETNLDLTSRWSADLAMRYENYETFGSTVIWKAATRFELADGIALRGSLGTGFRAPTTGQINMTQTAILTTGGVPANTGLYPADHPVALFLGSEPLGPEESMNYSLGATFSTPGGISLTVDAYRIEITDQIYATSLVTVTPEIEQAMIEAGVAGAGTIDRINFFQNAFDSHVQGLDVVGSYTHRWRNGQSTAFMASFNYNQYRIDGVNIAGVVFNEVSIFNFENNRPEWRGALTATHEVGRWSVMGRANLFGPYARQSTASGNPLQSYNEEIQVDLEVQYRLSESQSLTLGGRNVFDNYPDVNRIDSTNGRLYFDGPVDWQGGFYYARLTHTF